ncbi:thioesterase II family protein [Paenibacillus popilliae]|uniref:Predicted thioesterase n=1 Tax=Paenibacillus popilliae ATCC 14706 TaxID=1212764 RepID=M9LRB9_PAEPP|nr:thioesterase II family protein [Paenibacillus popilliae]GAC43851.1 predicted thioesterase [Paenibacillus popilliae ATCC 14706]
MKTNHTVTPWLLACPQAKDKIRLFCFPYAGGGAYIYRGWREALPIDAGVYPIQLPGRENRITEPPICDMKALVDAISEAISPFVRRPFILYGHSLGARIAFELARHLRRKWNIQPCHLIVSGSRAPHLPESKPLHHLPDEEFVKELRRFSGTPEALLQSKELMELFIPVLRADFTVDETYVYAAEAPLDCPISAFGGTTDPEAHRKEMEAWASFTSGDFRLDMIEGDHFFLKAQRDVLLRAISQLILQHME